MNEFTLEEENRLREALKRCPTGTAEAAVVFRKAGDRTVIPLIVMGVIERFVERDLRPKLRSGDLTLRLAEDLAMDSLTMMETVMLLEEVLLISIDNDELRPLRTLGDIHTFIDSKLSTSGPPQSATPLKTPLSDATEWTTATEERAHFLGSVRLINNAKSAARD